MASQGHFQGSGAFLLKSVPGDLGVGGPPMLPWVCVCGGGGGWQDVWPHQLALPAALLVFPSWSSPHLAPFTLPIGFLTPISPRPY